MKTSFNGSSRFLSRVVLALLACGAVYSLASACRAEAQGVLRFAQTFEQIPAPAVPDTTVDNPNVDYTTVPPDECMKIVDPPLTALSTNIQPRNAEGQDVSNEKLPTNCAQSVFTEHTFMSIDLSCNSCSPRWCDVLGLAHFCHQPLYFEEKCLERCGQRSCCCQPSASAACFFGGALLLPFKAACACPCTTYVPAHYGCP